MTDSPEQQPPQPVNASLLRRLGAMLYDFLLLLGLIIVVSLIIATFHGVGQIPSNLEFRLTMAVCTYVFFVGFWSWKGRTLGMQSWGLQLERMDGGTPDFGQSTLRFFAAILSWLPAGLGFWWQLWDRDRLTWHDRLSKTRLRHYPRRK